MFGRKSLIMQKRIEHLEWIVCKGEHEWAETGMDVIGSRKEPQQVILLTCRNCGKEAYKPAHMASEKKFNPIGFREG